MIGKTLGHYRIVREVGRGGMGIVYLAEDTKLGREVAVKVLRDDVSAGVAAVRFSREVRVAAGLQHPRIVPVHDSGKQEGQLYYVMPYIEGETLKEKLARDGSLPVREAIEVARQVSSALAYAHSRGVVHRDVKPSNVLLSQGEAIVSDFGLARALDHGEQDDLTSSGLGTPLYMSPEQATGAHDVDARSDVYGVGCLIYEMIAGRPPFVGATPFLILAGHANEPAPHVREMRPETPEALERLILSALEKNPEDRFSSAEALARALERCSDEISREEALLSPASPKAIDPEAPTLPSVGGAAARFRLWPRRLWSPARRRAKRGAAVAFAVLLVAVLVLLLWIASGSGPVLAGRPVVAVLPLENLSGNPALDHIGAAIAHALTTEFSTLSDVTMISPGSTREISEDASDPKDLARALGATFLISGSIQEVAERLRVNVNLVGADGSIVWGSFVESTTRDWFDLQSRIAQQLGDALELDLNAEESRPFASPPTSSQEAYANYTQARAFLERPDVSGSLERSIRLFQSALEKDPGFALAHAGLGEAYWLSYERTGDTTKTELAREAIEEALALEPDSPSVPYALAVIYHGTGRSDAAAEELRRALALQPNYDDAYTLLGDIYASQGNIEAAVAEFERAIEIRPTFWKHHRRLGLALFNAGDYPGASRAFKRITELQPDTPWGFQMLGVAYHSMGRTKEAVVNYEEAIRVGPVAEAYSNLGTIHYREGRYREAAEAYENAIELRPKSGATHRNLGDVYHKLNRSEEAQQEYLKAVDLTRERLLVNPNDARSWARLAVFEAKLDRHTEAIQHATEAARLAPEDWRVLYPLAVVHALAGRNEPALVALGEALSHGYSPTEAEENEDLILLRERPEFRALVSAHKDGGS